jgi:hypothetical protein
MEELKFCWSALARGYEVRVPRQYAKPETSRERPWPGKLKAVTASRGHLIQIIMHVKNALSSGHWFAASKPGYQLGRSMTAAARLGASVGNHTSYQSSFENRDFGTPRGGRRPVSILVPSPGARGLPSRTMGCSCRLLLEGP